MLVSTSEALTVNGQLKTANSLSSSLNYTPSLHLKLLGQLHHLVLVMHYVINAGSTYFSQTRKMSPFPAVSPTTRALR